MVNENDLRTIIAQVLSEMNLDKGSQTADAAPESCQSCAKEPVIEEGCIPDVTEVDIREQYLVENPVNKEAFYDLKQYAPCRLGIGKAGGRYKTDPSLQFRAAHSAAQDAVFSDVDQKFIDDMGLFSVQTQCGDKDTYLTRPDLGRKLSEEAVKTIKEKCQMHPQVQVYVSD